jgi:CheY-like chemotaxis protein
MMILSSGGSSADSVRGRKLGISASLTKPILPAELLEAICNTLGKQKPHPASPSEAPHKEPAGPRSALRILLAEDNEVNQEVSGRMLEKMGHDVKVVENGREVLAILESDQFDVVIMDIEMPEMDGFAATRAIREKEKLSGKHQKILAMTAHAMSGDKQRCLDGGMDAYIAKPIRPAKLFETLEGLFEDTCHDGANPDLAAGTPTETRR